MRLFDWLKKPSKQNFLSSDAIRNIENTIAKSEKNTSAEIRLYIEKKCKYVDPLDRCKEVFASLDMHRTADRNGVLLYIAYKDHQTAIYGDINIHKISGKNFWQKCILQLTTTFQNKEYEKGICDCLLTIGDKLKKHFPYHKEDINELPNEIVFGHSKRKKKRVRKK